MSITVNDLYKIEHSLASIAKVVNKLVDFLETEKTQVVNVFVTNPEGEVTAETIKRVTTEN